MGNGNKTVISAVEEVQWKGLNTLQCIASAVTVPEGKKKEIERTNLQIH